MSARTTLLALVAALAPAVASAQFATTNVQALYGLSGFKEKILDYNAKDGQQLTLTVNHFSVWKYGDNFAFVDMSRADYLVPGTKLETNSQSTVYTEWHPRFFVNKMVGHEGNTLGIFKNWGPAFEVNQGKNFWAYLAGIGCDIDLPIQYSFLSVNLFYRQDSVQFAPSFGHVGNKTWQLSPSWGIPFAIGPVSALFTGFVDITPLKDFGGKDKKLDVMAQPELLFDVGGLAGAPRGSLWLGVEWYLHYNAADADLGGETISAPQVMVQWNLH
ncbi:MAG: ion channel protein Tsx [Anaeromyxobacteraceae bacterium]